MLTTITGFAVLLVPAAVTAITGYVKTFPTFEYLSSDLRVPAVRFIAALVSFIAVLVSQWVSGSFDSNLLASGLQTVIFTAATWFASLGIFHGIFQK